MAHFVCSGTCAHVSDKPGQCGNKECNFFGKHFIQCDCADGQSHQVTPLPDEKEEERD